MVKPRIAFVLPALNTGGAQRVVTTLANSLIADYEVYIITFIDGPSFYKLDENIKIIPCVEHISPSKNIFQAIKSNYLLYKRIRDTLTREKINLVIGFLTSANVLSVLTAKSTKTPVIISERNNPKLKRASIIWQILRRLTYPKADYVVVQTETIKKFYIAKINKSRLIILPNPIAKALTLRRDLGTPKENLILNAGRLTDQKRQDILIKAFSKISHKDWKLVLAGEGPNRTEYENLIGELGLNHSITMLGNYSNIYELYNRSKIFAFSSAYEGFPNALIEAMHFGLACVSTDCPTGPSELIRDGENGYLVPVNDVEEMAKKLEALINDPDRITSFGEKAVHATEPFEERFVTAQWKELIDKLTVS